MSPYPTLERETSLPSYYVKSLAMALPAIMLGLQLSGWIFFLPGAMQGHCDFRHLYAAAYMIRTGHTGELYDYGAEQKFQDRLVSPEPVALPFNHLAYEALLFLPYSCVSYRAGYFLFVLTNIVLLAIVVRLMGPWTQSLRAIFPWLPAAMFFTFTPVAAALIQGQDSIILLLLFTGGFVLLAKGRTFTSGFLIGLGLLKFQIVIPVAVLFLLWRRWRFFTGFASSCTMVVLISMLLVGPSEMNTYAHSLLAMSVEQTTIDQMKFNVYPIMMPNLRGLVYVLTTSLISRFWVQALTGVGSLGVLLCVAVAGNKRAWREQFLLATTAAAFLSYHLYIHDLSMLLVPITVLLDLYFGAHAASVGSLRALASTVMFAAPGLLSLSSINPFISAGPLIFLLVTLATRAPSRASMEKPDDFGNGNSGQLHGLRGAENQLRSG